MFPCRATYYELLLLVPVFCFSLLELDQCCEALHLYSCHGCMASDPNMAQGVGGLTWA